MQLTLLNQYYNNIRGTGKSKNQIFNEKFVGFVNETKKG